MWGCGRHVGLARAFATIACFPLPVRARLPRRPPFSTVHPSVRPTRPPPTNSFMSSFADGGVIKAALAAGSQVTLRFEAGLPVAGASHAAPVASPVVPAAAPAPGPSAGAGAGVGAGASGAGPVPPSVPDADLPPLDGAPVPVEGGAADVTSASASAPAPASAPSPAVPNAPVAPTLLELTACVLQPAVDGLLSTDDVLGDAPGIVGGAGGGASGATGGGAGGAGGAGGSAGTPNRAVEAWLSGVDSALRQRRVPGPLIDTVRGHKPWVCAFGGKGGIPLHCSGAHCLYRPLPLPPCFPFTPPRLLGSCGTVGKPTWPSHAPCWRMCMYSCRPGPTRRVPPRCPTPPINHPDWVPCPPPRI